MPTGRPYRRGMKCVYETRGSGRRGDYETGGFGDDLYDIPQVLTSFNIFYDKDALHIASTRVIGSTPRPHTS